MSKILIVDDEPDIVDSLAEFFTDAGFAVITAADGAQALERLAENGEICVVILDLIMPVVDGNKVYDQMRADPKLQSVPVIVQTSDPSRAPSGPPVFGKPVNLTRLLSAVRQYCL
jgi:CheY-like chemotaxis protein